MSATPRPDAAMGADAFLLWSDKQEAGHRHELLDGRIVELAAERAIHARTKYRMVRCLEQGIAAARLPCEALVDGMAVRVDDRTVFEPDAVVRCGPRLPDDALVIDDPVIVVEVASPSTQRIDALVKLTRYFRNAAIAHYLIVMPDQKSLLHHRRGDGDRIETTICTAGVLWLDPPGLSLDVVPLFAPETLLD